MSPRNLLDLRKHLKSVICFLQSQGCKCEQLDSRVLLFDLSARSMQRKPASSLAKARPKTGGRWNRVGIETVYASLDVLTATKEAYQNFIVYKLPLSSIRPRVMAGAEVVLSKLLDITDASIRRELGFTREDLVSEDCAEYSRRR